MDLTPGHSARWQDAAIRSEAHGPRESAARVSFHEFVDIRYRQLVGLAYLLTGDHHLAEDLVQAALVKSWTAWRQIRGDDPEAYVRRVMVTTYASWWRRKWWHEHPSGELPDSASVPPDSAVNDRTDLWRALGGLTPRQRAVVVLRFFGDRTEAQAADILGCSVGTVKSQTSKALARLRVDEALRSGRGPTIVDPPAWPPNRMEK